MNVTVLEVVRGEPAKNLARSALFPYSEPIAGQEYLAVRVQLNVLQADPNQIFTLYPYFSLTLRYEDGGTDTWSETITDHVEG